MAKTQIKFYKVETIPSSGLTVGAIYFEISTGIIGVATSETSVDVFGEGIQSAAFANGVITITGKKGTTTTIGDIASKSAVEAALAIINGEGDGSIKKAVADTAGVIRGEMSAMQSTLEGEITKKVDDGTVYLKSETYTQKQVDDKIAGVVADAISLDIKDGEKYLEISTEGSKLQLSSKGIDEAIAKGVAGEASLRAADKSELQDNINTEKNRIDTLIGTVANDDTKSVRTISAEEVAKIVANAPESYNTLEEIATWIAAHPGSVAELNEAIAKKADQTALDGTNVRVSTLEGLVGNTSVDAQIVAKIDALDASVTSDEEARVVVSIEQVDGKVTSVSVEDGALHDELEQLRSDVDDNHSDIIGLTFGTNVTEDNKIDYGSSHFIEDATTMYAADVKLDAKLYNVDERLKTVEAIDHNLYWEEVPAN